ncbi:MAG: HEAT repeat domain-containing protein [Planctomycetes bacterium]|nr:HEAT repeat domain-containing protein [Planctomycetota bacterium]
MRALWLLPSLLLLAAAASAEDGLEKLSEAARATFQKSFPGAKIQKLKEKSKDGATRYELKLTDELNGDKAYKVELAAGGKVLKEDDHAIAEPQVPPKVIAEAKSWCRLAVKQWRVQRDEGKLALYVATVAQRQFMREGGGEEIVAFNATISEDGKLVKGDQVPQHLVPKSSKLTEEGTPDVPEKTAEAAPKATGPKAYPFINREASADEEIDTDVLRKVTKLVKGTLDADEKVREKAWAEINDMGNLAVPGLLAVFKQASTTSQMVSQILIALEDSKDPRAGPALVEILADKSPVNRGNAARAIGDTGFKKGLPALEKVYENDQETEGVRLFAASSAAKLGSTKGLHVIGKLAESKDAEIRKRAVYFLGKYGGSNDIPAVAKLLADADTGVREDAVEALRLVAKQKADDAVLGALIEAVGNDHYKARSAAMSALREVTGQQHPNEPKAWQDWWAAKHGGKLAPEEKSAAPEEGKSKTEAKLEQDGDKDDDGE